MDGQQFDRLARAVGSGKSRRSLLKSLSAVGFGALLGSRVVERAAAQETCESQYGACSFESEISECCEGLVCTEFWDVEVGGRCWFPQTCSFVTESCVELECCDGMVCNTESICEYGIADYCSEEEQWCGTGIEPGMIVNCCDGLICTRAGEGSMCIADPDYCLPEDGMCGTRESPPCCGDLVCSQADRCEPPIYCAPEGEICGAIGDADSLVECCHDLPCYGDELDGNGGTCGEPDEPNKPEKPEKPYEPVYELPDTGSGQGSTSSAWVAPAAVGVAAAVVGGALLKNLNTDTQS